MARNVTVVWVNPTARTDGEAATPADIAEIRIDMKLQTQANYTRVATITNPTEIAAASRLFPNQASGNWRVRVGGIDKNNQPFNTAPEVDFVVPQAALNGVTGLTVNVAPAP